VYTSQLGDRKHPADVVEFDTGEMSPKGVILPPPETAEDERAGEENSLLRKIDKRLIPQYMDGQCRRPAAA
jgi:hypothetical protein